jgi:hypothetical protein
MTFHAYLSRAVQDDAQLAAERDRLLVGARRGPHGAPACQPCGSAVRRRLARLLLRRAPAQA